MFNSKSLSFSFLCIFSTVLFSCGGGGGGSTPPANGVNPGITGRVFIGTGSANPFILDITSGHYTRIPGADWSGSSENSAYPIAYGNGAYVETSEDCAVQFRDCIIFRDASGTITSQFELNVSTFGPARASRDGENIAVLVDPDAPPFKVLNVYRRDGTLVVSSADLGRRVENHDFDWIVKNGGPEVVYINGQSIYDSTNDSTPLVTIDVSLGVPGEPSVSPDNSQIAFTIGAERSSTGVKGTIWVVNSDGTGTPRQLTAPILGQESIVGHRSPIWSPDGEFIFVNDQTTVDGIPYVVPAEAEAVVLTQDAPTVATTILSFFDDTRELQGNDPIDLETDFRVKSGSLAWLP